MGCKSKLLTDMIAEFMICEIGSKALDGITYVLTLKSNEDMEKTKRYMQIKNEVIRCGYSENEIFRVYELSNGYIFDLDLSEAKKITAQLVKAVDKLHNSNTNPNVIGNMPDKRREHDMEKLARLVQNSIKNGKNELEIALFSRNSTNKIMTRFKDKQGNSVNMMYNAFALRHLDIERVNEKYLIPKGIVIDEVKIFEVLPARTGASFLIKFREI